MTTSSMPFGAPSSSTRSARTHPLPGPRPGPGRGPGSGWVLADLVDDEGAPNGMLDVVIDDSVAERRTENLHATERTTKVRSLWDARLGPRTIAASPWFRWP